MAKKFISLLPKSSWILSLVILHSSLRFTVVLSLKDPSPSTRFLSRLVEASRPSGLIVLVSLGLGLRLRLGFGDCGEVRQEFPQSPKSTRTNFSEAQRTTKI